MDVPPLRLFCIEDVPVFRTLLEHLFAAEPDLQLAGCAATLAAARPALAACRPDVVLLDRELPDGDGLQLLPELGRLVGGARVILCSTLPPPSPPAGIHAVFCKGQPLETLLALVRACRSR